MARHGIWFNNSMSPQSASQCVTLWLLSERFCSRSGKGKEKAHASFLQETRQSGRVCRLGSAEQPALGNSRAYHMSNAASLTHLLLAPILSFPKAFRVISETFLCYICKHSICHRIQNSPGWHICPHWPGEARLRHRRELWLFHFLTRTGHSQGQE